MADEEISEELQGLNSVADDVDEHVTRLKGLHQKGKLEGNVADELVGTILPLLSELSDTIRTWASSTEELVNEIADELDDSSPGGDLDEEDLEALRQLYSFAVFCAEGAKANAPPKAQKELIAMLQKAEAVLEKLGVEKNESQEDTQKETDDSTNEQAGSGEDDGSGEGGSSGDSESDSGESGTDTNSDKP